MSRRYLLLKRYQFPQLVDQSEPEETSSDVVNVHLRQALWKAYRRGYRTGLKRGELHGRFRGEKAGYSEGFEKGKGEGYTAGYGEGLTTGEGEVQTLLSILNQLWLHLAGEEKTYWNQLEDNVMAAVESICTKVVREELKHTATALETLVQETLELLPQTEKLRVTVNPRDKPIIERLSDKYPEHWHIQTDNGITAGGCVISAGSGEADARVETRLQHCFNGMKESLEDTGAGETTRSHRTL